MAGERKDTWKGQGRGQGKTLKWKRRSREAIAEVK
jgi:hypothetical protein